MSVMFIAFNIFVGTEIVELQNKAWVIKMSSNGFDIIDLDIQDHLTF